MRVLVLSDSHKRKSVLEKIINRHIDVNLVLFLGDGVSEFLEISELYPDKRFVAVAGNNDSFTVEAKSIECVMVGKTKILLTHGHLFNVSFGRERLLKKAKENNYDIVLYGHTHISRIEYKDEIYLINPGSVSRSREGANSYAVIDILENGIFPIIMKV